MNELALFAGAGGGILGGKLLGWKTICAVEWEPYPTSVLITRQNEGILAPFPIWDDVCTFDGRPWRGRVDVVSGGFPCQDISAAGKGAGIDGARSGMWSHMARIVREVGPRFVFVENSPMLTSRGLGRVLGDLAAMGYDARWGVLGAVDAGAPHKRDRIWIVADALGTQADSERGADQCGRVAVGRDKQTAQQEDGPACADRPVGCGEDVADAENPKRRSGQFGKQNPSVWPQGNDESFGGGQNVAHTDSVRELQPEGSKCDLGGRIGDGSADVADANSIFGRAESFGEFSRKPASDSGGDVADAEKQFARRLPIGTSSEYPRLGVSGENVADAMRERSEAGLSEPEQRKEGITEKPDDSGSRRGEICHSASEGLPLGINGPLGQSGPISESERSDWWATEPDVGRVAHGVAARVDRLKAIGNGQVSSVAALAWRILSQ